MASTSQSWFSIIGYLYVKTSSGAFSLLKPRKRLFFALEESENLLVSYKDDMDFLKKKEPLEEILLDNAACTLVDHSDTEFIIYADGRKFEFDAENEHSANKWFNALQHRRESFDFGSTLQTDEKYGTRFVTATTSTTNSSDTGSEDYAHFREQTELAAENVSSTEKRMCLKTPKLISRKNGFISCCSTPSFLPSFETKKPIFRKCFEDFSSPYGLQHSCKRLTNLDELPEKSGCRSVAKMSQGVDEWILRWINGQPFEMSKNETESILSGRSSDNKSRITKISDIKTHESDSATTAYDEPYRQSELSWLRAITNRQKAKIQELNEEKKVLSIELAQLMDTVNAASESVTTKQKFSLANRNKFLNGEVIRLLERCATQQKQTSKLRQENEKLEEDLNNFKREYVFLLQSCIRIPLDEQQSTDVLQVKLLGGHVHKKRVTRLLNEARKTDPTLPTFESLTSLGNYLDIFGFRRSFDDEELALHYICTQLYQFYAERRPAHLEHRAVWKQYLHRSNQQLSNTSEMRNLVRTGVPGDLRPTIWKLLIHQQVDDIKRKFGKYYFRNLCNTRGSLDETEYRDNHQKQITLDLLRTMPGNIHFMSPTCKGIQQLEQVLRAFCLHNPAIGYCQGMNFIAGAAMLFVGAEDTFWFLVAVTERYFNNSYFDHALTGAQADQEVLKELVARRLPRLAAHLEQCGIDLATVTLNWFLALFYDAVPFQTMIRIWDCFLLEGTKMLFRFALAILSIHEKEVLRQNDTISVIKILKASVRLTYDHEGLFNLVFDSKHPFPSRSEIEHKQKWYLDLLRERLNRKEQLRKAFTSVTMGGSRFPAIELVTFSLDQEGMGFICAGDQSKGIIVRLNLSGNAPSTHKLDIEFDCKILSMVVREGEIAYISLLSSYIVAVQIKETKSEILWELKMLDIVLKLLYKDGLLYAALANGVLTVIENVNEIVPTVIEMLNLPISAAPIAEMSIVEDTIWLAAACKVTVICMKSLVTLRKIYVASSPSVCSSPMFEKIRCMCPSSYGVWIATANSQVLQLWKDDECLLIHDLREERYANGAQRTTEITSVLCVRQQVWVGTMDGYLLIYHIIRQHYQSTTNEHICRYWNGHRMSQNVETLLLSTHPTVFLPSMTEVQQDESASQNEHRFTSSVPCKTSVVIDPCSRRYSVFREICGKSATAPAMSPLSNEPNGMLHQPDTYYQSPKKENNSSLQSSLEAFDDESLPDAPLRKPAFFQSSLTPNISKTATPPWTLLPLDAEEGAGLDVGLASPSISQNSLEYDDLFELYSEDDKQDHRFGKLEERCSSHKSSEVLLSSSSSGTSKGYSADTIKLRRKDLEFDEFIQQKASCSSENGNQLGKLCKMDEWRTKITLVLEMKLKISDKQIKCGASAKIGDETVVVTCAGDYGEAESILKWTIDQKVSDSRPELWVNEPVVDETRRNVTRITQIPDTTFKR